MRAARAGRARCRRATRCAQGGETEDQQEVFGRIFSALGVAIMLMYLILVVQFGSFLDPLAILLSLPLSLIGVMLGAARDGLHAQHHEHDRRDPADGHRGEERDPADRLREVGGGERAWPRREALIEAGRVRLRPILMTTFALIAGMIPVALGAGEGADFRAPLGRAVIGGVITSTLLTLLVIPTFYEILTDWRDWLGARLFGRTAPPHGAHVPAHGTVHARGTVSDSDGEWKHLRGFRLQAEGRRFFLVRVSCAGANCCPGDLRDLSHGRTALCCRARAAPALAVRARLPRSGKPSRLVLSLRSRSRRVRDALGRQMSGALMRRWSS